MRGEYFKLRRCMDCGKEFVTRRGGVCCRGCSEKRKEENRR